MELNGQSLAATHFREDYIKRVITANAENNTNELNKLFFSENKLIVPKDIHNPSPQERLDYDYSFRKRQFIEKFQNRFNIIVFGSARSKKSDACYKHIKGLVESLAEEFKLGIITGGGPGIMNAGNESAITTRETRIKQGKPANIKSIGVDIVVPFEETKATVDKNIRHQGFFSRIPDMLDFGNGAYAAPGGIGSLFEKLGVLQLKQVGHLEKQFPLIVHPIYKGILNKIYETMYKTRHQEGLTEFISPDDIDKNIIVTDKIPEIVDSFKKAYDWWYKNFRAPYKKLKEMNSPASISL